MLNITVPTDRPVGGGRLERALRSLKQGGGREYRALTERESLLLYPSAYFFLVKRNPATNPNAHHATPVRS